MTYLPEKKERGPLLMIVLLLLCGFISDLFSTLQFVNKESTSNRSQLSDKSKCVCSHAWVAMLGSDCMWRHLVMYSEYTPGIGMEWLLLVSL